MQKHSVAAFIALLTLFACLLRCVVNVLQQTCRIEHDATESAHLVSFIRRRNNLINCLTKNPKAKVGWHVFLRAILRDCRFDICGLLMHDEWLRHNCAQKHPDCHTGSCSRMCICAHNETHSCFCGSSLTFPSFIISS